MITIDSFVLKSKDDPLVRRGYIAEEFSETGIPLRVKMIIYSILLADYFLLTR